MKEADMPRQKRIWYEGACYHVMGRGNRRAIIFREQEDYALFLKLLLEVQGKYPFDLHAYCLMTNHFHLELTTKKCCQRDGSFDNQSRERPGIMWDAL